MSIDCVTNHVAYIYDRGGQNRLFQLLDLAEVRWGRVRDDVSEANIKISANYCFQQRELLDQIEPGRHELVIYRGSSSQIGYVGERVWEGPITRLSETETQLEIHARDVVHYLSRTNMANAYNNAYPNVTSAITRAETIIVTEMTRKETVEQAAYADLPPYNVLPYAVFHHAANDARTARSTARYQKTVWEEIDDMAAKGGIDYTAVGRAIHVWDTSKPLGVGPTVTQKDFLGPLTITHYGMELATHAVVTDGEGNWGDAGGVDPYYGLVENLETAYDETEGTAAPTSEEMASQAVRNLNGRNPTPVVLRVPDGSQVNPNGALSLGDLVPGVHLQLRATILVRTYNQMQKLDKMEVVETAAGETVTVTLSPASQPDEAPVE